MIEVRENRDPTFWRDVQSDPDVYEAFNRPPLYIDLAQQVLNPRIRPFAGPNGGFLAVEMEGARRWWDIHAAVKRPGWGKEAHAVFRTMVWALFADGAAGLTMLERHGSPNQRPPLSFGWRPMTGAEPVPNRDYLATSWLLSRNMWYASPAHRRMFRQ